MYKLYINYHILINYICNEKQNKIYGQGLQMNDNIEIVKSDMCDLWYLYGRIFVWSVFKMVSDTTSSLEFFWLVDETFELDYVQDMQYSVDGIQGWHTKDFIELYGICNSCLFFSSRFC
eukprot:TRINITY_DN4412_c0_g1_i14.p8 TRINITY_DN4412_c0_g1~~TRINITY_DN4412_c0_g1_i14.p8  ORF type:complete len:119 (-),score=2.43 TRINITY_DN4412_c0_g1_i14:17-373(-)